MGKKLTIQELSEKMKYAVREKALDFPGFDYGSMRFLFVAQCNKAVNFLGGFGKDCHIDLGYPIKLDGSHTRPAQPDLNEKECACYGYAANKIEGCACALRNNYGRRSCDMPEKDETWGRVSDQGCIVYDVYYVDRFGITDDPKPEHYLRIYVSVSGATGQEDEYCAYAAGLIIENWCNTDIDDDGFGHYAPYLSFIRPGT